ncbi:MAG TPA: AraC family transcriptional regulator [Desulfobacterales bacterium]|nr:AraC family transcriptional regulator [Desulfobacterales bacterium]HIP40373.1 AraC family transcriptional regulator [Desulfocapsa sulfexigens]
MKDSFVFTLKYKDEAHYSRGREDAALAWIMSLLRVNFQNDIAPVSVHLTHPKPDCSGKYYEFFKSPVHFNSSFCRLALPLPEVDRILPGANEEFAEFGDQAIKKYLLSLDAGDEITQIKKILIDNLPSGNITIEQVAGEFGVNTRTLQRILQKKGTTFLSLLNETRMEIAKKYIQDKYMDLTEIAFLLGFAELSTFSRSFKRWTGKSPIQYRKAA